MGSFPLPRYIVLTPVGCPRVS